MIRPVLPPSRYPFYDTLLFVIFVLVLPPILASTPGLFNDGDSSWHIAAGRWIIEHRQIPGTDPFSFTMAGKPWVAHEWLSEVLLAGAFGLAAHAGVSALVAAALAALHLVVFLHLRARVGPAAILVAFAAMDLVLAKFFLARPHLLVWPLVAAWTSVLLSSRDRGRPPPLWLAALMLVWTNLHGSFPLGFIIAAAIGWDAVNEARWNRRILLGWLSFGLLATIAALLNASGASGLLHPLVIMDMETLPLIQEWRPSSPGAGPLFFAAIALAAVILAVRRVRFGLGEGALLVLMLALALSQVRHQSWLAIVAPLVLASRLGGVGRKQAPPPFAGAAARRSWVGAGLAAAVLLTAGRALLPYQADDRLGLPRALIANIPAELSSQPVFNEYSFGGPLILAGIRPYIDGRADMYGDAFFSEYVRISRGDSRGFRRAVERYGIRWTMLQPSSPLVKALDASPGWSRIYSDEVGVIHVRRDRGSAPARAQPPA